MPWDPRAATAGDELRYMAFDIAGWGRDTRVRRAHLRAAIRNSVNGAPWGSKSRQGSRQIDSQQIRTQVEPPTTATEQTMTGPEKPVNIDTVCRPKGATPSRSHLTPPRRQSGPQTSSASREVSGDPRALRPAPKIDDEILSQRTFTPSLQLAQQETPSSSQPPNQPPKWKTTREKSSTCTPPLESETREDEALRNC